MPRYRITRVDGGPMDAFGAREELVDAQDLYVGTEKGGVLVVLGTPGPKAVFERVEAGPITDVDLTVGRFDLRYRNTVHDDGLDEAGPITSLELEDDVDERMD